MAIDDVIAQLSNTRDAIYRAVNFAMPATGYNTTLSFTLDLLGSYYRAAIHASELTLDRSVWEKIQPILNPPTAQTETFLRTLWQRDIQLLAREGYLKQTGSSYSLSDRAYHIVINIDEQLELADLTDNNHDKAIETAEKMIRDQGYDPGLDLAVSTYRQPKKRWWQFWR